MSDNCARDGRTRRPAGRNGCTTLLAGQAFARPASTKALHTPVGAVRSSADGRGHQRERNREDQAGARLKLFVQAALALDLATWLEIASIKAGDRQS